MDPNPWASKYAARDEPTVLRIRVVIFEVVPDGSVIVPTIPAAHRVYLYTLGAEADAIVAGVEYRVGARGFFGVNLEDPSPCSVVSRVADMFDPTVTVVGMLVRYHIGYLIWRDHNPPLL